MHFNVLILLMFIVVDFSQDKADDILVGVKSTALRMGDDTKTWLTGFTALIVSSLTATGVMCDQTWPYFLGVAMFGGHLGKQV